jgi:outer membrane protein TolC
MAGVRLWTWLTRRGFVAGVITSFAVYGVGCRSSDPLLPPQPASHDPGVSTLPREADGIGTLVRTAVAEVAPDPIAPPLDASEQAIDLEVALRLAGVDNPTINLARERVQEGLAAQLAARSLLLPSINIGGNYHLHNGRLQAGTGQIRNVNNEQSLYFGLGAQAVGSGTVAYPGIRLFAHLGDAAFEPLAARQEIVVRRSDAQAVQNDILLRVATAYLSLIEAEARLDVLRKAEIDLIEIVRLTRSFANNGQGRKADADRTATTADLFRQEIHRGEEQVAVASARLCALLNLDPSFRLRTPGGAILPIKLISEEQETEPLVNEAIGGRPDLMARAYEIREAQIRVRQERVRPLLPLVSVGVSGGWFGGGSNATSPTFGSLSGRTDFDVFAVWNIQNLGFGNRMQVRRADANVGQATAAYERTLNAIRREVIEAQADARAAARQIELAKNAVLIAEDGFKLESTRIREGQGRPIEVVDSFNQLSDARQQLVRSVVAYNIAQFRLFVATGSNPLPADIPPAR